MIKKVFKWLGITAIVLLVGVIAIAGIGSSLSLARDYTHTRNTQALPLFSSELATGISTGIVRIAANGYEFRARIAGNDQDGPTVILLHGFPVTSAMWEPIIPPLANAGYRVIAFDQRGYSPAARPRDADAYAIENLVSDVIAIADATGAEQFHLVAHDWGSAVGWVTVMQHPDRVLSWTGLSIAHPAAFADALENDPEQQANSSYFALFTMPLVPETLFTFNNLTLLINGVYAGMQASQIEEYLAVFSEPYALTAALNWYRQMQGSLAGSSEISPEIDTPTLFIWGRNDPTAGQAAVDGQERYIRGPYRRLDLDGEHWLVTNHSPEITQALLQHLESY